MPTKKNLTVDFDEVEIAVATPRTTTKKQSETASQKPGNAETQKQNSQETSNATSKEKKDAAQTTAQQPAINFGGEMPRKITVNIKGMIIPRTNGCTYYLEDKHIQSIALIKALNGIDKQDIIRTAVNLFLAKYQNANGMGLNSDGVGEVEKYLNGLLAGEQ